MSELDSSSNPEPQIDCHTQCVNGCILGDKCPNRQYLASAFKFIEETSLDTMIDIAEEAKKKKLTQPPNWIIPDFD